VRLKIFFPISGPFGSSIFFSEAAASSGGMRRGSIVSAVSLQERLVFEEDALRKRDLFSVAAGDSGQLPDKYDPVSVFLHQNYQRHYHEAVAVNHHQRDEEEEKKKTDSTLPLLAEASFVSEDDDGPPEDTSDLVRASHVPVPCCALVLSSKCVAIGTRGQTYTNIALIGLMGEIGLKIISSQAYLRASIKRRLNMHPSPGPGADT